MNQLTDIVRGAHAAFAKGDIPAVLGLLAPSATWTEAEGGTYKATGKSSRRLLYTFENF